RPDPGFGPCPVVPDAGLSDLLSLRHCRRCVFSGFCHFASTHLPPFAPRELPRFLARMRALTSAVLSSPTIALLDLRISLLTLPALPTIPSPTTFRLCPCCQLHTTPTATGLARCRPPRNVLRVASATAVRASPFARTLAGELG